MRRSWRPDWIDDEDVTQEYYDAQAAVYMPRLPPVDAGAAHVVRYLMEIGPTLPAGMSAGPVSFSEIDAWRRVTGSYLSGSDARLIRRLSVVYLNESMSATEQFYPPPWWPDDEPRPPTKEEVRLAREKLLMQ